MGGCSYCVLRIAYCVSHISWFVVHRLFFENFYPSLTLGALYALWRVSADTRSPTKTFEDKLCGSSLYLRLLAVPFDRLRAGHVSLLANNWVLYQKTGQNSSQFEKNVQDKTLPPSLKLWRKVLDNWLIRD